MYLYLPIESELDTPCAGQCRMFGLRVLRNNGGQDEEVMVLPDISTDFIFTLRLASLFTRKQLDPLHLMDVLGTAVLKPFFLCRIHKRWSTVWKS